MKLLYPDFDGLVERWQRAVYSFCLLLVQTPGDARQAVFQTFLYLGARGELLAPEEERAQVFAYALRSCEDYFYRKGRRPIRRRELEGALAFPVEDGLWHLIRRPLKEKAAFYLVACLGCPAEEAGRALGESAGRVEKLAKGDGAYEREALVQAVSGIAPDPEWAEGLLDELYFRFEERSVGVENRLRDLRLNVDRAVPWVALAVILLCVAAVLYTASLPAPPPLP